MFIDIYVLLGPVFYYYYYYFFFPVITDVPKKLPPVPLHSSHHPPGAVSYNVTLHQHQAPPGAHDGKAGSHNMTKAIGGKQMNQSKERNKYSSSIHLNGGSSTFPYKVYEISKGDESHNGPQEQSTFAFHEFDRLDTLLNLSVIHRQRALDISRYLIEIGKATIETGLKMVQIHGGSEPQSERDKKSVKIGHRLISAGERILSRGEKVLKAVTRSKGRKTSTAPKPQVPAKKAADVQVVTPIIKMISLCSHGPSHYGVTLLGGIRAGHFVGQGKVDSMQACIKKCCANHKCDLAFMVKEDCYSVICYHKDLCRTVRAQHIRRYQPRIAHIWRGSSEEKQSVTRHNKKSRPTSPKQRTSKYKLTAGDNHKEGVVINRPSSRPKSEKQRMPKNKSTKVDHQHEGIVTKTHPISTASPTTRQSLSSLSQEPKLAVNKKSGPANSNSVCPHSSTEHNVGLRRGLKTGHFSYIGELSHMKACLEVCCHDPDCDIAFMLDQSCYTVTCASEAVCHSIPYHQHKYSTKAVFVTRRFNKHASRHVGHHHSSTEKPKTAAILNSGSTTDSSAPTRKMRRPISQSGVTTATVTHGSHRLGLRHSRKQRPTLAHVQNNGQQQSSTPRRDIKESQHKARSSSKQNSSELWQQRDIKIDLIGGQNLTPREKETDPLEIQTARVNEEWEQEQIKVQLTNVHNLKDVSSSKENKNINLIAAQNFTEERKDSELLKTTGKTSKDKWQNEKIKIHLPSSSYEKSHLTLKADQNASNTNRVDARNKVPNVTVVSSAPFTLENPLLLDDKETEYTRVYETQRGRNEETAFHEEVAAKFKVNFTGKSGLLQGEPDYYKPTSEKSKLSHSYGQKNSKSLEQEDESNASAESGRTGSSSFSVKGDFKTESSLSQGEPDYSMETSEYFMEKDQQSGSTESGISSTTMFGSAIDYDTSNALDLTYPESYEEEEDLTSQGSADSCATSDAYYNVTLRGGLKAGNFSFVGIVSSNEDCVSRCCLTKGCDVTFVVLERCFLVHCYDTDLCDITAARNTDKFRPVITYVNLTIINTLQTKVQRSSNLASNETLTEEHSNINSNHKNRAGEDEVHYGREENNVRVNSDPSLAAEAHTRYPGNFNQSACTFSEPLHNKSLRLGRKAGVFTNQGTCDNIRECAQWCCQSQNCDVAFMISQDCFSVRCYSSKTCRTFAIHSSKFNPRMVFVERSRVILNTKPKNSSTDALFNPARSYWSMSTSSAAALYPITYLSSYAEPLRSSAAFNTPTSIGNNSLTQDFIPTVAAALNEKTSTANISSDNNTESLESEHPPEHNPSDFVEVKTNGSDFWWQYYTPDDKKLPNSNFNAALPDSVDPSSSQGSNATPQLVDKSHLHSATFKVVLHEAMNDSSKIVNSTSPQILDGRHSHTPSLKVTLPDDSRHTGSSKYRTSLKFVDKLHSHERTENKQELCSHTKAESGVTLRGGYYAGVFTRQDNATSLKECVSECCRMSGCNLAFMVANICYAVQCFSEEKCTNVKAHYANRYHPRVAYVRPFDGNLLYGFNAHVKNPFVVTNRLRCVLDDISEPKYKVQDGSILVHSTAHDLGDCAKLCCQTKGCEMALEDNGTCYSLNCRGNLECPQSHLTNYSRTVGVIKDLIQQEKISESLASKACDFSQVLHEVVLRGGSKSGKFKYLVDVEDMETCIKECCRHKVCDVALMLKDNCFLVSCHNERLCDAIPSRSSEYRPQIAYKIKHGKRRHIGKTLLRSY